MSSFLAELFGAGQGLTLSDVKEYIDGEADRAETDALRGDLDAQLLRIAGMDPKESAVVRHRSPANKVSIPEVMTLDKAELTIKRQREAEETSSDYYYRIRCSYLDGLVALQGALQAVYGMSAAGVTKWSFFGEIKPVNLDVQIGLKYDERSGNMVPEMKTVPASEFDFGPMEARIDVSTWSDGDLTGLFMFSVNTKVKYRHRAEALKIMVEEWIKTRSIYRGQICEYDPSGAGGHGLRQVDRKVDSTIVYSADAQRALQNQVFGKIDRREQLQAAGLRSDFRVLMYGPLGTGKSAGMVATAIRARAAGMTVIEYRPTTTPTVSELQKVWALAKLYGPTVILVEDFDRYFPLDRTSRGVITNLLDGVDKSGTVSMVMTTNFLEKIDASVVRPPRMTGLVEIKHLDREGIEELLHRTLGDQLADDIDFDQVWEVVQDYSPAFIRTTYDNARAYAIQNDDSGLITTEALVDAAKASHGHHTVYEQLDAALKTPEIDHLRVGLAAEIEKAVEKAVIGEGLSPETVEKARDVLATIHGWTYSQK